MSYTISISGHVSDEAEENVIVAALSATIAGLQPDAGVTSASGSFQYAGTVDLLPPAPTAPAGPYDVLNAAMKELSTSLAELNASEPQTADVQKAAADVQAALTDLEDHFPNPTPSLPEAPPAAGSEAAASPTTGTGDNVAL